MQKVIISKCLLDRLALNGVKTLPAKGKSRSTAALDGKVIKAVIKLLNLHLCNANLLLIFIARKR